MKKLLLAILLSWAAVLTVLARYAMLDDALIHLRYASMLHDRHFISYDGVHPSYGTSSLLYVALLALLRTLTTSPLLPKVVSVLAYIGLLAIACWLARANRLAVALTVVLVSPMAVRWLTDGMETSLVCVFSMALPILLHKRAHPAMLALIAAGICVLRVELGLLVGIGVLLMLALGERVRALSLCLGAAMGYALVMVLMGHLLPDTAVAKTGVPPLVVFYVAAREIAGALSFGCGALLLWILSAIPAWRTGGRQTLIANLPFPALILLAVARGQQIQGIRYLIWALLFSITWNLLAARVSWPVLASPWKYAVIGIVAIAWGFELPIALRIDRDRSQTLLDMQSSHLDRLRGEGVAADVGFIGYFSKAPICDIDGLVNGRAAAAMTIDERKQACAASHPDFLFLNDGQIAGLPTVPQFHLSDWIKCGSVAFTNVGSEDRHRLWVRKADYPGGCPAHLPHEG
ncbi:MAG TPA: hypothetical protein VN612_17090 [Acidobacteriaceae bacterium]|nr:hypothetical protein [Acidobacteriaceae bacterium]